MTFTDFSNLPSIDFTGINTFSNLRGTVGSTSPTTTTNPGAPAPTGTTTPPAAGSTNPTDPLNPQSQESQSAKAIIMGALATYGLSSLADQVWQWYLDGRPLQQIFLDLKNTPEYQRRFPAMNDLAAKGHAISEAEYISAEQTYTQLSRQFGLPVGFYDNPDDFTALIAGEVSPSEYQARLQSFQALAFDADPTARNELQRLYGISPTTAAIAVYSTDVEKLLPILQRQVGAAEVSAAAQRSGYGGLSQAEGELLSGVTQEQAQQGFGTLVDLSQVLGQLPGEADAAFARDRALGAVFQGDEQARQEIVRRQRKRVSQYESGGGFTQSDQGISGIG